MWRSLSVAAPCRYSRPMNAVQQLQRFLESGAFKALIDRVYPLDQIVEAHGYAESERKIGNVVIGVASTS